MTVLIVNHSEEACGVWQFGKRFADLATFSTEISYAYRQPKDFSDFKNIIDDIKPEMIIYNWYPCTMSWLTEDWVARNKQYRHFFIWHDGNCRKNYDGYIFSGAGEKDAHARRIDLSKAYVIPRPLFKYTNEFETPEVLTIGTFGFGGWHKGFPELVTLVEKTFDKAIINMHMSYAHFGDAQGVETRKIAAMCRGLNKNPDVKLNITHPLMTNEKVLDFLAKNDINVFLYAASNEGLSSVIDYALSVKVPMAISKDMMFRHVEKPEILVDRTLTETVKYGTIDQVLERGIAPLQEFYSRWHPNNFIKELDEVVKQNTNQ